ncbi:MAG: S8 family serine peptidase [Bryobacterales bacterium]|nr:S8 family serine peptidase [Bryobacteraceae bacterium]MDW8129422.1 S8 family serine peptidase [Bryobacterales bacterium]
MSRMIRVLFAAVLLLPGDGRGADRYALILEDPPVASQIRSREELESLRTRETAQRLAARQQTLRRELARRNVAVTGAAHLLVNAVFVRARPEQVEELSHLPGVRRVVHLPPIRLHLDRALDLSNARLAWERAGGPANAGAGVKIGVIDSGIDHGHPALLDDSLSPPPGYPKCVPRDCPWTSNKVIVARSYVEMLAAGTPPNPAEDSRPDDLTPRDRVGHGTAIAVIAAGRQVKTPSGTISGVAPKAFLGNYKVFGSPGVNDNTYADVLVAALEDALRDGMDVVTLALGTPALYGPLDAGAACGTRTGEPCDLRAWAVENAVKAGLLVVVSAGNDGDFALKYPALGSVNSPGTAPSALTVGAITNAHVWFSSVRVPEADAPAELRNIPARFGDGPRPAGPLTAPVRDVERLGDDGRACRPLPSGSLAGAVALVQRGGCSFAFKVSNAESAGAAAVLIYQLEGQEGIFSPAGLAGTGIPAVMIPNSAGKLLKRYLGGRADARVTLDPTLAPWEAPADEIASFSSRGPSLGENAIKPELVTVGTDLFTATQTYDPNSEMWDPSGYTAVSGTSFAVGLAAGAAALVKQQRPAFTPAQVKSALVHTANPQVFDDGQAAAVTAAGAGKLDAAASVESNLTVEPATLSFGVLGPGSLGGSRTLTLRNASAGRLSLLVSVVPRQPATGARLALATTSLTLEPGASTQLAVRLEGTMPPPGSYEGEIRIEGAARTLRVPYLYIVSDNVPYNAYPLLGYDFDGVVNSYLPGRLVALKVTDRYGAPVANVPVRFRATRGGGYVEAADPATDVYGIAAARVVLGPLPGEQQFVAEAAGLTVPFDGWARLRPTIAPEGVVNAASFARGAPVAPGSYVAIFGWGLADTTRVFFTPYLPLSLAGVSVSFDAPQRNLSLPGRLHFVSPGQVNVQVPWELQGLNSVLIKVSIGNISSAVYTLPLADYSPAFFEKEEAPGRKLLVAQDENYGLITSGNPVRRGRVARLYANGLGPVDPTPPTGEPALAQPLSWTRVKPRVTIGGKEANVLFHGLTPGAVALYQLDVVVPEDAPTGLQEVTVTIGGVSSKAALLPVQ